MCRGWLERMLDSDGERAEARVKGAVRQTSQTSTY
jgi:hypothetical protein